MKETIKYLEEIVKYFRFQRGIKFTEWLEISLEKLLVFWANSQNNNENVDRNGQILAPFGKGL